MFEFIYPLSVTAIAFLCFRAFFRIVRRDTQSRPIESADSIPFQIYASVFGIFWLAHNRLWRYAAFLVLFALLTTVQSFFAAYVFKFTFSYSPSTIAVQLGSLGSFIAQCVFMGLIGSMLESRGLTRPPNDGLVDRIGASRKSFLACSAVLLLVHFLIFVFGLLAFVKHSTPADRIEYLLLIIGVGSFFPLVAFFIVNKRIFRFLVLSLGAVVLLRSFFLENLVDWIGFMFWFLFCTLTVFAGSARKTEGSLSP